MAGNWDDDVPRSPSERGPRVADDAVQQALEALTKALSSRTLSEEIRTALGDLERAWERARHGAQTDPLTQLPNRLYFERALAAATRDTGRAAVMFLDLDGFKAVNDRLGHRAGDLLLNAVARRVASSVRDGDLVARYGGDEFVVLLTGPAAARVAPLLARRIVENVSAAYSLEGATFRLSVSVGLAMWPEHARDADALIERADRAMYRAKRCGGGRYALYEASSDGHQEREPGALGPGREPPF